MGESGGSRHSSWVAGARSCRRTAILALVVSDVGNLKVAFRGKLLLYVIMVARAVVKSRKRDMAKTKKNINW